MTWHSQSRETKFRRVYDAVFPVILRIVFRITNDQDVAEELCHEAFIKYYEQMERFPDPDQAKYWLIRVSKNFGLNYVKRKVRERRAYERALREPGRVEESGETAVVRRESYDEVRDALTKLPEKLRSVLIMKEYGDLNYKEIGAVLGISEANVKVRVFRARERLAVLLKDGGAYVC